MVVLVCLVFVVSIVLVLDMNIPYHVERVLGRGGFGVVYAGVRTSDGMTVAIKEVAANKVLDWSYLGGRSVPLELSLLYFCQSVPGVVRLIDFYDRGDHFLIIMERPVNTRDLFDFISLNRTLGEERARNMFKQVVDTVIECYERGVVHRDIKDENLIVDMDTVRLKLIDFGSGAFVKNEPFHDYDGKIDDYPTARTDEYFRYTSICSSRVDQVQAVLWRQSHRVVLGDPPL